MAALLLNAENFTQLASSLQSDRWVIACLCAAWCDVCKQYRNGFDSLALEFPEHQFVWIDIEDQAELVGDLDVENFPTLLMQRGDVVTFYGTVMPEPRQVARLLEAQIGRSPAELEREAHSSPERQRWQLECNLSTLLQALSHKS